MEGREGLPPIGESGSAADRGIDAAVVFIIL